MDGTDVAPLRINACCTKSIVELAEETKSRVRRIKEKKDLEHKEMTDPFKLLPDWVVVIAMELGSFLAFNIGYDIPALKVKANGAGSVILTNVSSMNYTEAWAPICNFLRNSATSVLCKPFWETQVDSNGENPKP